jgi:hypothetical protein
MLIDLFFLFGCSSEVQFPGATHSLESRSQLLILIIGSDKQVKNSRISLIVCSEVVK